MFTLINTAFYIKVRMDTRKEVASKLWCLLENSQYALYSSDAYLLNQCYSSILKCSIKYTAELLEFECWLWHWLAVWPWGV